MVLQAGVEAGEGVTLRERPGEEFEAGLVAAFVAGFDDEVVAPLGTVGVAAPVGFAEKSVFGGAIARAAEPIPPLHPQPQSARAIGKTKKRKNSDL